jgi:hypothetical protein
MANRECTFQAMGRWRSDEHDRTFGICRLRERSFDLPQEAHMRTNERPAMGDSRDIPAVTRQRRSAGLALSWPSPR